VLAECASHFAFRIALGAEPQTPQSRSLSCGRSYFGIALFGCRCISTVRLWAVA
jgi:hypothetical protein